LPLTVDRFLRLKSRVGADALGRALGDVGAGQLGRSQMRDLSGGELRRVLLARALLGEPELLVLDEPVQGVDVAGQSDLYALITQVRDRLGCGILMVSHDLHVVMAATDRVICLNRHVCCAGRPEAVSRHPEYQALFGPAVARRFAVYTHAHDHRHDAHGDVLPLRAGPAPEKRAAGAEPEEARSEK
jgi:zinc transport system ATP-binding protein